MFNLILERAFCLKLLNLLCTYYTSSIHPCLYFLCCNVKETSTLLQHRKLCEHTETLIFYKGLENKCRKKSLSNAYDSKTKQRHLHNTIPRVNESISTLIGGCSVVSELNSFLTKPPYHHFFHSKLYPRAHFHTPLLLSVLGISVVISAPLLLCSML